MKTPLQLPQLFPEVNQLHDLYGGPNLCPIYGAGCIYHPNLLFVFINPTARNISANPKWPGIRAPWLGTKNIWKMIYQLELISQSQFNLIQHLKPKDWTPEFSFDLYHALAKNKVYITNLAKCTQLDARPLNRKVFLDFLPNILAEIRLVNPKSVVCFGRLVSSFLPQYFSTYYPVGQGMRNMAKTIEDIKDLMSNLNLSSEVSKI